MCYKAISTYPSTIKFDPEFYKTQEMCNKAVNRCFLFDSIPDRHKTQVMCGRFVSEDPFVIVYCPDHLYETQKKCDKAVDYSLAAFKLVPDWLVTSKMIKDIFTALYTDENMLYFNDVYGNVMFSCNEMGILNVDLNNVNLDNNFDENHSGTIILLRLLVWHNKFEKCKALKKSMIEELMSIACMSEDDKK